MCVEVSQLCLRKGAGDHEITKNTQILALSQWSLTWDPSDEVVLVTGVREKSQVQTPLMRKNKKFLDCGTVFTISEFAFNFSNFDKS